MKTAVYGWSWGTGPVQVRSIKGADVESKSVPPQNLYAFTLGDNHEDRFGFRCYVRHRERIRKNTG